MTEPAPQVRLFVALTLPAGVRAALPDPGEGWRRLPDESLHVTLAFLGWREEGEVPAVVAALDGSLPGAGPLRAARVVLLPPRRPRVMAVRLEGPVSDLQAAVSDRLAAAGLYEPEKRPFLAHVTIGRARGAVPRGAAVPEVSGPAFQPEAVTLYRSLLSPRGARYEPLASWRVSGPR